MPVKVQLVDIDEAKTFPDTPEAARAYTILSSGVLQILAWRSSERVWVVDQEFSPAAWQAVTGTRYNADTSQMRGTSALPY